MKKIKKVLFILFIILLIIAGSVYIDFFIASKNNTHPKISIKKDLGDGLTVYNAVFYRMWYCKENKTYTLGDYDDPDAICKIVYDYDKGYYTNGADLKISKHDLEMIRDVYDSEVIETMNSDTAINNAVYVAEEYKKLDYKPVVENEKELKQGKYPIVVFPVFKENGDDYKWVDGEDRYCIDDTDETSGIKKYAPYEDNKCGEFVNLTYNKEWCELYTNSKLYFDEEINKLCKGVE